MISKLTVSVKMRNFFAVSRKLAMTCLAATAANPDASGQRLKAVGLAGDLWNSYSANPIRLSRSISPVSLRLPLPLGEGTG